MLARGHEQPGVVIDETPVLLALMQRRGDGAQVRARAAAEIDDLDAVARATRAAEMLRELVHESAVARRVIGALAQAEPIRRKNRSCTDIPENVGDNARGIVPARQRGAGTG